MTPRSQRSPRKWDGLTSTVSSAKSMGAHSRVTTHLTAVASIRMVLPSKKHGGASKSQLKEKRHGGANFVQIVCTETKKALHKQSHQCKKCHANGTDSDDDSNYSA